MSKISWNNYVWPLKISFCIQIILGDEYSPLAGVQFFFFKLFQEVTPQKNDVIWCFCCFRAMFRCAISHGLTLFPCRATCRNVAWRLDSKPWGNGPKLEGLAWRHFLSRMARMAIPKFHALHQIQKAITLRSLRWKHQKKQETSQRQELKGFIGFIGLNTSRKSWKSSSWWGTFRTKHSTFGFFIRLGELNDDHDLQYGNKIHWTRKIAWKPTSEILGCQAVAPPMSFTPWAHMWRPPCRSSHCYHSVLPKSIDFCLAPRKQLKRNACSSTEFNWVTPCQNGDESKVLVICHFVK